MQRIFTLVAILVATLLPLLPNPVRAQPSEIMCHYEHNPVPFFARKVILIGESITERPSREPGVFYRNWIEIDYREGQAVLLTGSADLGAYHTDDRVRITTSPSGKSWEHDFRSADHMGIVPLEDFQDLTDMMVPGINTIEIVLEDVLGPVYSSSNYWILVMEPCPGQEDKAADSITLKPTTTATSIPPTAMPSTEIPPTATPTKVASQAVFSPGPPSPSQPDAIVTLAQSSAVPVMPTPIPLSSDGEAALPFRRWAMMGLLIMGGCLIWALRRYRPIWRTQLTVWTAPLYDAIGPLWEQLKAEILQPTKR